MREMELFGYRVNNLSMRESLEEIDALIHSGGPSQAVFLNAAKIVEMDRNPTLADSMKKAELCLADGQSVVWAARILGRPIPERVAGIDLMFNLLQRGNEKNYRFYFLGATQDVLEKAVAATEKKFAGVKIAGYRNGYFAVEEESKAVEDIRKSGANVLFVGMSSPKKELFIERHLASMGHVFAMGVGGSFDVLAGKTLRAPRLLQKIGMEWVYRLFQEPGRMWKRYLVGNTFFLLRVLKCFTGFCTCCTRGGN